MGFGGRGSPAKLRFAKVEGPVRLDSTTYLETDGDASPSDFVNARRNAAAVISAALTRMHGMGDGGEKAGSAAKEIKEQAHDVLLEPDVMDTFMDIVRDGIPWVNATMTRLRAENVMMDPLVKLAIIARLIAARYEQIVPQELLDHALVEALTGGEVGPITRDDCEAPLRAPVWAKLSVKHQGGLVDLEYCATRLTDYGGMRAHETVWVKGTTDPVVMVLLARELRVPDECVGFHVPTGGRSITHFNVYPKLAAQVHTVTRNTATEVVTTSRRYNTSCPQVYVVEGGELVPAYSEEGFAMQFFRTCDVIPQTLGINFTNAVEAGASASGYTFVGEYRKWAKRYRRDAQMCAEIGRTLLRRRIGPYHSETVRSEFARQTHSVFIRMDYMAAAEHSATDRVVKPAVSEEAAVLDGLFVAIEGRMPDSPAQLEAEMPCAPPEARVAVSVAVVAEVAATALAVDKAVAQSAPSSTYLVVPGRPDLSDPLLVMMLGRVRCPNCTSVWTAGTGVPETAGAVLALISYALQGVSLRCPNCCGRVYASMLKLDI